jgi:hypothetical protein
MFAHSRARGAVATVSESRMVSYALMPVFPRIGGKGRGRIYYFTYFHGGRYATEPVLEVLPFTWSRAEDYMIGERTFGSCAIILRAGSEVVVDQGDF